MTWVMRPVNSSWTSSMLMPRTTSWKRTVPVSSVRMKVLKGSHSAKAWRDLTSWPSGTRMLAP